MHHRLTHRYRSVMDLANQEAQKSHHEYILPEHLLVGLIKEGSDIAVQLVQKLGIDASAILRELENATLPGTAPLTDQQLPASPAMEAVTEQAIQESLLLNDSRVGTEHILLALLHENSGAPARVLANHGLRLEMVRQTVAEIRATDRRH